MNVSSRDSWSCMRVLLEGREGMEILHQLLESMVGAQRMVAAHLCHAEWVGWESPLTASFFFAVRACVRSPV